MIDDVPKNTLLAVFDEIERPRETFIRKKIRGGDGATQYQTPQGDIGLTEKQQRELVRLVRYLRRLLDR